MARPLNILLAEDNPDDVFLLKQAIRKAGVSSRLSVVSDGMELMAYLKREGSYANDGEHPFPDVVLLDLNMPRMNGFEALESLRRDPKLHRVVIHVLSSSARPDDVARVYDLRANSYVVKPTRLEDLVAFVTSLHQWHCFTAFPHAPNRSL